MKTPVISQRASPHMESAYSRVSAHRKKDSPDGVIREIVHASFAQLPDKSDDGKGLFAEMAHRIFNGERSALDDPAFYLKSMSNVPPLPLDSSQLTQLGKIVQSSPICLDRISLMELLGLSVYSACTSLEGMASEIEKKKIRSCKNIFCRHWMIGYISHANRFVFKMRWTYTPVEFTQEMERFMDRIVERREKSHQDGEKDHYEMILNSIEILLKLWQSKDAHAFLQGLFCYHFQALAAWFPKEQKSHEYMYQGVQTWIDFVTCAFKNTEVFHNGRKDILPSLELSKTLYSFSSTMSEKSIALMAAEGQKSLLKTFVKLVRENKDQAEQLIVLLKKGKSDTTQESYSKRMNIFMYNFIYIKLYGNNIFLLEHFVQSIFPTYLTSHACLSRIDVAGKVFCQHIVKMDVLQTLQEQYVAMMQKRVKGGQLHFPQSGFYSQLLPDELMWIKDSLKHTDVDVGVKTPLTRFFSHDCREWAPNRKEVVQETCSHHPDWLTAEELTWMLHALDTEAQVGILLCTHLSLLTLHDRQLFFEVSVCMAREVSQLFKIDEQLLQYAQKTLRSPQLNRSLWLIEDYNLIYPTIKKYLDALSCGLDALHETHSRKMIDLVDALSIETCRVHKEKILCFFEGLFLDLMSPFSMLATFKHDLDLLLPEVSDGRLLDSADSSIVSYFLMLSFEKHFIEKITPVSAFEVAVDSCGSLVSESETSLENKMEKKDVPENRSSDYKVGRRVRNRRKHCAASHKQSFTQEQALVDDSVAVSKCLLSPLSIRKGEKLNRIVTMLHEQGMFESHSKGGHTIFENDEGFKVTLPIHGDGHVSNTVRRHLMQRVNAKP